MFAGDTLTQDAALACLTQHPGIRVLSPDEEEQPRAALILTDRFTPEVLDWMRQVTNLGLSTVGFVLVTDEIHEHHLLSTLAYGPVSVIARHEADVERIVRTVVGVTEGRLEMPNYAIGWLVGHLQTIQRDVLQPRNLTTAGLENREVDVIRLLAEGLDTAEIATVTNYSERTVKTIIQGVLTRRRLHNRAHAVAYALRAGMV
jgi:DNA-binding NarL/FixJ family response regulator